MRGTYVVLQRTLARLELGLDLLALRLVGGGGELARKLRLKDTGGRGRKVRWCTKLRVSCSGSLLTLSGFFASIILQGRAADRVSFWASRGTRAVGRGGGRTAPSGPRSTTRTGPATR